MKKLAVLFLVCVSASAESPSAKQMTLSSIYEQYSGTSRQLGEPFLAVAQKACSSLHAKAAETMLANPATATALPAKIERGCKVLIKGGEYDDKAEVSEKQGQRHMAIALRYCAGIDLALVNLGSISNAGFAKEQARTDSMCNSEIEKASKDDHKNSCERLRASTFQNLSMFEEMVADCRTVGVDLTDNSPEAIAAASIGTTVEALDEACSHEALEHCPQRDLVDARRLAKTGSLPEMQSRADELQKEFDAKCSSGKFPKTCAAMK